MHASFSNLTTHINITTNPHLFPTQHLIYIYTLSASLSRIHHPILYNFTLTIGIFFGNKYTTLSVIWERN